VSSAMNSRPRYFIQVNECFDSFIQGERILVLGRVWVGTSVSLGVVTKRKHCDMTPEIGIRSLLSNGGKHVPAELYIHATIEELPFLCNSEANTPL
jgi:hypothetical protein